MTERAEPARSFDEEKAGLMRFALLSWALMVIFSPGIYSLLWVTNEVHPERKLFEAEFETAPDWV